MVHVVHELVNQRNSDLFDLALGIGHLAHEDVAAGVDAALGVCVEHGGLSSEERVQGHIVLDVFRDALAPRGWDLFEVARGKGGIYVQVSKMASIDLGSNMGVADVGLEEIAHLADAVRLFGFLVGKKLLELVFDQLCFAFELRNKTKSLLDQFPHRDAAVDASGATQLLKGVELVRLVKYFL